MVKTNKKYGRPMHLRHKVLAAEKESYEKAKAKAEKKLFYQQRQMNITKEDQLKYPNIFEVKSK